jgi:iduronate 2-sulfatase
VRKEAFSVAPMRTGFLLRNKKWAFIQYGEKLPQQLNGGFEHGRNGIELFDMEQDRQQFINLANTLKYQPVVESFRKKLKGKLAAVRNNDLQPSQ